MTYIVDWLFSIGELTLFFALLGLSGGLLRYGVSEHLQLWVGVHL